MASEADISDLAEIAFQEIQGVHEDGKPPINHNQLVLSLTKGLSVPLADAQAAVKAMEREKLGLIMERYSGSYIVDGVIMNHSSANQFGSRYFTR